MNDNSCMEVVRGQSALPARPPNGARVAGSLVVGSALRAAQQLVRAVTARCARGGRPLGRRAKQSFALRPRGAAQLAPR